MLTEEERELKKQLKGCKYKWYEFWKDTELVIGNFLTDSTNSTLKSIPGEFPPYLEGLASFAPLETIPNFPKRMEGISICRAKLESLPPLPPALKRLYIVDTPIREIPPLPAKLEQLVIGIETLSDLPELPETLQVLITTRCWNLPLHRMDEESEKEYLERWREYQSMQRVQARMAILKEELLAAAFHPDRIGPLIRHHGVAVLRWGV